MSKAGRKNGLAGRQNEEVRARNATFRVKLISGGRITVPTAIRELLGVRDGDYIVCSARATENEKLPSIGTLWRILLACRRGLSRREIARKCRLSDRESEICLSLLVDEEFLSVENVKELEAAEATYRTTERGRQIASLVASTGGIDR